MDPPLGRAQRLPSEPARPAKSNSLENSWAEQEHPRATFAVHQVRHKTAGQVRLG